MVFNTPTYRIACVHLLKTYCAESSLGHTLLRTISTRECLAQPKRFLVPLGLETNKKSRKSVQGMGVAFCFGAKRVAAFGPPSMPRDSEACHVSYAANAVQSTRGCFSASTRETRGDFGPPSVHLSYRTPPPPSLRSPPSMRASWYLLQH